MPQTTRWRFCEFTGGHYTRRGQRVKWFAQRGKGFQFFAFRKYCRAAKVKKETKATIATKTSQCLGAGFFALSSATMSLTSTIRFGVIPSGYDLITGLPPVSTTTPKFVPGSKRNISSSEKCASKSASWMENWLVV